MSIVVTNLGKSFAGKTVLRDVSFAVHPGRMTALVGPSGCGKSTLLHCVAGLTQPDSGTVTVAGAPVPRGEGPAMQRYRAATLGYLFQDFALIPDQSAVANVLAAVPTRKPRAGDQAAAHDALVRVGLSEAEHRQPVNVLSGGEQQRVAIARLLFKRPPVVLADEPTGSLDQDNGLVVAGLLRQIAKSGSTVLVVTHSPAMADACDECLTLG